MLESFSECSSATDPSPIVRVPEQYRLRVTGTGGALIREGVSNKEIAYRLGVTEGTVKAHLTTIFRVLGVANRSEAARLTRH